MDDPAEQRNGRKEQKQKQKNGRRSNPCAYFVKCESFPSTSFNLTLMHCGSFIHTPFLMDENSLVRGKKVQKAIYRCFLSVPLCQPHMTIHLWWRSGSLRFSSLWHLAATLTRPNIRSYACTCEEGKIDDCRVKNDHSIYRCCRCCRHIMIEIYSKLDVLAVCTRMASPLASRLECLECRYFQWGHTPLFSARRDQRMLPSFAWTIQKGRNFRMAEIQQDMRYIYLPHSSQSKPFILDEIQSKVRAKLSSKCMDTNWMVEKVECSPLSPPTPETNRLEEKCGHATNKHTTTNDTLMFINDKN